MRAAALALVLAGAPAGAQAPVDAEQARTHSVRKLYEIALPMAREWSPGAQLYSAYGRGPRNAERWEPEVWGLIFGDPRTRDGYFSIEFSDGVIRFREGVKAGVKMEEKFRDGRFDSRDAQPYGWDGADYSRCRPMVPGFVDVPALEKVIARRRLQPDSLGQFGFSLFRPLNELCDGLGRKSLFLREKPLGYRLLKRSLWAIATLDGVVYVDARDGSYLRFRSYESK